MDPDETTELLTPEELADYPLRRATRGYAIGPVDELLDRLAAQTEQLLADLDDAHERVAARDHQLAQLRERLDAAVSAAEREVAGARRAGEGILAEARAEAEQVVAQGRVRGEEKLESALRRIRAEEADLVRRTAAVGEHLEVLRQFAADHRSRLEQHLQHELARLAAVVVPPTPESPDIGRDPLLGEPDEVADEPLVPSAPWDDEDAPSSGGDARDEAGTSAVRGGGTGGGTVDADDPDATTVLGEALFVDRG